MRQRIEQVRERQNRTAAAEAAPGGVTIVGGDYVNVTFAEKPERDILDALRGAGFRWGSGCWTGQRAKLPQSVLDLIG